MRQMTTHVAFLLPSTLLDLQIDRRATLAAIAGVGLVHAHSQQHDLAHLLAAFVAPSC